MLYVLFFIVKLNFLVDSFDTFRLYKGRVPMFAGTFVPRYLQYVPRYLMFPSFCRPTLFVVISINCLQTCFSSTIEAG